VDLLLNRKQKKTLTILMKKGASEQQALYTIWKRLKKT
jgi:hypothetical protein